MKKDTLEKMKKNLRGPAVSSTRLLADLRDCEDVFVSGNPIDQQDAKELRCKVTITGPTRLLTPLMDALTANAGSHRQEEV